MVKDGVTTIGELGECVCESTDPTGCGWSQYLCLSESSVSKGWLFFERKFKKGDEQKTIFYFMLLYL